MDEDVQAAANAEWEAYRQASTDYAHLKEDAKAAARKARESGDKADIDAVAAIEAAVAEKQAIVAAYLSKADAREQAAAKELASRSEG